MAEKEPEDIAVILPASKRHWTTFNAAVYPTLQHISKRDLSLRIMSSCTSQWGQEKGAETPVQGWRQRQGTLES